MRTLIRISIAIAVVGLLGYVGFWLRAATDSNPPAAIRGTRLQFVARHGALGIYTDLSSTNETPDFALFRGNECVVLVENIASNNVETTHFENGLAVMVSRHNKNMTLIQRSVSFYSAGNGRVTYLDNDGDGMWDALLDYGKDLYYVRSNLSWVIRH